jgi:hypothetical protein
LGCDSDIIADDWGPPAGWAQVVGTVRNADGSFRANAVVRVSQCEVSEAGFASEGRTDASGRYSAWASLPPVGLYQMPPTGQLVSKCVVSGQWVELRASAEVELTFVPDKGNAEAVTVDLTF